MEFVNSLVPYDTGQIATVQIAIFMYVLQSVNIAH